MPPPLGNQTLIDLYECAREDLDNVERIRFLMLEAARVAGATVITDTFHYFSPHGVSGVVILAESHLAIHTWPEHRYAAIDLFTCGSKMFGEACLGYLVQGLDAGRHEYKTTPRGLHLARAAHGS